MLLLCSYMEVSQRFYKTTDLILIGWSFVALDRKGPIVRFILANAYCELVDPNQLICPLLVPYEVRYNFPPKRIMKVTSKAVTLSRAPAITPLIAAGAGPCHEETLQKST